MGAMSKAKTKAKPAPAAVEQAWPADQVVRCKVADLLPYARNSRTHSDAQVAKIAASIREFGFTNSVLRAPDNTIIAGHGRVLAANKLGLDTVPVITAHGWTKAQIRAYVIADNRLALDAGWDDEMLKVELQELSDDGYDLALTGFGDAELAAALSFGEDPTDPAGEWDGMPGFDQPDATGIKCIVHFENEVDKAAFEKLIAQRIPENTKAIWYPAKPTANMRGQEYGRED